MTYLGRASGRRRRFLGLLRAYERRLRRARDEALAAIAAAAPNGNPTRKLEGWKAIAGFMRIGERTAREYASRVRDPLPVQGVTRRWAHQGAITAWMVRHSLPISASVPPTRA